MKPTLLLLFLSSAGSLLALDFDPIFGSHMVLQQGRPITVKGTCKGGAPVTLSFGDQKVQATVKGGKWQATLQPLQANAQGRDLTVTQGSATETCEDVLVGEVWLASGQSNMLFRMDETRDTVAIQNAGIPQLRVYRAEPQLHTLPKQYTAEELERAEKGEMFSGSWAVSAPDTIQRMSAVGFYFGRKLQKMLDTPVGVINVSLGGSEMMAWMPEKTIKKKYSDFSGDKWLGNKKMSAWLRGRGSQNLGKLKGRHPYQPSYLYETGITPWLSFPMAGVIWYQGETDAETNDSKFNAGQLRTLICSWREAFKKPDMPFLMVQLPRINSKEALRAYWPEFRQVQQEVADKMPGVENICTIDLGSTDANVHPVRKVEVGERLALVAANKVYRKEDVVCSGPRITKVSFSGNSALVSFEHAEGLCTTDGMRPTCFELSANGKQFTPAEAEIQGGGVKLTAPGVKSPKAVRYAWATYVEPNLVNEAKLPAIPYSSLEAAKKKNEP